MYVYNGGFLGGTTSKESACNAGDLSSIPGFGKCPGGGHSDPLQYSCLEYSMDRGVRMTEQLTHTIYFVDYCLIHSICWNFGKCPSHVCWDVCFSWSRVQPRITNYISLTCLLVSFNVPDKKAFLSDQCKEIEKNNRMGKTRNLFKKIRDTKKTFPAKMGTIKDRNSMDLTEAQDIKKKWQKYTEEL